VAKLLLSVVSTLGVLLGFELALHLYVHEVRQYGRIFQTDRELGWSFIPGIEVDRTHDKHHFSYRVVTDGEGHRVARSDEPSPLRRWRESSAPRRLLVVGDSQAAGRGVDVDHRFDRLIGARRPDWAVLSVGTGGYDPCQELLVARRHMGDLRPGDVFVLLTTGNDFRDLLDRRPAGRAKPSCRFEEGRLAVEPPQIGLREWLRDESYLGYLVARRLLGDPWREYEEPERAQSRDTYERIVRTLADDLAPRGVVFVVAHNADWLVWDDGTLDVFARLASDPRIRVLALDPLVVGDSPEASDNVLGDLVHWSRSGHAAAAAAFEGLIDRPEIAGAAPPAVVTASGTPAPPTPARGV